MAQTAGDHRAETAARNRDAILDAAESLLEDGAAASTSAVARKAGLSRVTVYAHFADHESLLEAIAERVVERFAASLAEVDLENADPIAALDHLIALAWSNQGRYEWGAEAILGQLGPGALDRAHTRLHKPIAGLIDRGKASGAFRTELPTSWLLASYFALMHTCAREVAAGRIEAAEAVPILRRSLLSLLEG